MKDRVGHGQALQPPLQARLPCWASLPPGPQFTRPLQVCCGLAGQARMAPRISPRDARLPAPHYSAGEVPPQPRLREGPDVLGSSPLAHPLLAQPSWMGHRKVTLVSVPVTLKPVPGQGMPLGPSPHLPRGSCGKEWLKPLSLASCPHHAPASASATPPGFPHCTGHIGVPLLQVGIIGHCCIVWSPPFPLFYGVEMHASLTLPSPLWGTCVHAGVGLPGPVVAPALL